MAWNVARVREMEDHLVAAAVEAVARMDAKSHHHPTGPDDRGELPMLVKTCRGLQDSSYGLRVWDQLLLLESMAPWGLHSPLAAHCCDPKAQ